jgi:hypothetical protein
MRRSTAWVGAMLLLAGCDDGVVRVNIGAEGGTLEGYGAKLVIPAGALTETQELTLAARDGESPSSSPLSPLYQFGPSGLQLAVPAHLDVEIPAGKSGLLYWSKPGHEEAFEVAGLAFGGKADGITTHFSDAYVGEGMCPLPQTTTKCACRADDEYNDLLCPTDTSTDHYCPDINGFSGQDGGSCSGYGPRPDLHTRCYCYDTQLGYLCQDHILFSPLPQCPTDGGLNGYVDAGEEGASCSGYINDVKATSDAELSGSGVLVDCAVESWDEVYDSHSGVLEGCYVTSAPESTGLLGGSGTTGPLDASGPSESTDESCKPPGGEDDPLQGVSADCQALIAQLEKNASANNLPIQACKTPPPKNTGILGSRAGFEIEKEFLHSGALMEPPSVRYTQVVVPNANKKQECIIVGPQADELEEDEPGTAPDKQRHGRLDLLRIVSDAGADPVVVEIAEVKPLTRAGLVAGQHEVFKCYAKRVAEAGATCPDPKTEEQKAFCGKLMAIGKTVVVAEQPGLTWAPSRRVEVQTQLINGGNGDFRQLEVLSCGPGLVAYRCPEEPQWAPKP